MKSFHKVAKSKKVLQNFVCRILHVWTKNEENCEIFDKISLRKINFSPNSLLNIGFLPLRRKNIPMEDNPSFLQQFFRFRGGGNVSAFTPSRRYWLTDKLNVVVLQFLWFHLSCAPFLFCYIECFPNDLSLKCSINETGF